MNILGINSFFEHPAVALISEGNLIFAVEDERFTGIKHGKKYTPYRTYVPYHSIYKALEFANITFSDIDEVAYSYSPKRHFFNLYSCLSGQRISSLYEELAAYWSVRNFNYALRSEYECFLKYSDRIGDSMMYNYRYRPWRHHDCHAASSYYCSGFESALVIVADGSGEADGTSIFVGSGKSLKRIDRFSIPNSLGLFYSLLTKHLGFEPFSDEYKVMGLSAYGKPRYLKNFKEVLTIIPDKGNYKVNLRALLNLSKYLGPPRIPETELKELHFDIAASGQILLETAIENLARYYQKKTQLKKLCLAGGVFLNCVSNGKLYSSQLFEDIFIYPAAHDAGTAVGAAILSNVWAGNTRPIHSESMFLGTEYNDMQIEALLLQGKATYRKLSESQLIEELIQLLIQDKVCGLFRGRMEFGPRSLGHRSILASPKNLNMLRRINNIKGREQFRPLAPMITEEEFPKFFNGIQNQYMMFTAQANEIAKKLIPAVVHVDGSSRVQVVRKHDNKFMHDLLLKFGKLSGFCVLINTSLNIRGRPIMENPLDAIGMMYSTKIDAMIIGNYLIES